MPHDALKLLYDVRTAAERIQTYAAGGTLETYLANDMMRDAVERQFTIIGEALVRLRALAPGILERIDDYRGIIRFRNILIHGYEVVDDAVV